MRTLILCLALSLSALSQARVERRMGPPPDEQAKPAEKPTKEQLKLAADLITQAQSLSGDLNPSDRAYVTAKLAELTAKRQPEQSQTWAESAFHQADDLSGAAKGSVQMSAMMAMSQNNLDRALEMLSSMESPRQRDDGTLSPDIRAAAATMLFARAFAKNGMKSVDQLVTTAHQIGENGFYPYMAVTQLMRGVAEKDKEKAQSIATDAITYINRRQRSNLENQQVTMFLVSARDFVPLPMMKQILENVVADALEQAKQSDGTQVAATFQNTAGDKVQLNSMATLMVFQLMPLIRDVDPDWAKKLEEQSDQLRQASALMRTGDVSIMIGARNGGGPNGPNGDGRDFRDEIQSRQIDELVARDPDRAMEMANNIQDPALHASAMARATAAGNDEEAKKKALENAKDLLARTSDPRDKLTILAGLAQSQAALKDDEGLNNTLQQALATADDMFRRSVDKNPSAGAWMRPGVDTASSIVKSLAKKQSTMVTAHVSDVRQAPLKALLLLSAVEALDPEAKSQSGPQMQFRFSN